MFFEGFNFTLDVRNIGNYADDNTQYTTQQDKSFSGNYPVEGDQICFESSDENNIKATQKALNFSFSFNLNTIISPVTSSSYGKTLGTIIDRKRNFAEHVNKGKPITCMIKLVRKHKHKCSSALIMSSAQR